MSNKKDFTQIDTGRRTENISQTIERGTSTRKRQTTPTDEERAHRMETLTTQGRKGCFAKRINLALTPSNHEFIAVVSKARGMTMTKYVNGIIAEYCSRHQDLKEKALQKIDDIQRLDIIVNPDAEEPQEELPDELSDK